MVTHLHPTLARTNKDHPSGESLAPQKGGQLGEPGQRPALLSVLVRAISFHGLAGRFLREVVQLCVVALPFQVGPNPLVLVWAGDEMAVYRGSYDRSGFLCAVFGAKRTFCLGKREMETEILFRVRSAPKGCRCARSPVT